MNTSIFELLIQYSVSTEFSRFWLFVPETIRYWKVVVKLKAQLYTYREVDLRALIRCLMDGTFYRDGTKLSGTQIHGRANLMPSSKKISSGDYIEIPAGKASSHGLSKWHSKNP
jgi:hypothetical protein